MRKIRFRVWDGLTMRHTWDGWSQYTDILGEVWDIAQNDYKYAVMQYTGLKDKNGVDVYEGDIVNVFYTSGDGEYNHDCIYKVSIDSLYGLTLTYVNMLWVSHGHNQYPVSTTLSPEYNGLSHDNRNQNYDKIAITDSYHENHIRGDRWKGRDYSNYIEVIGNIYQHSYLLDNNKEF